MQRWALGLSAFVKADKHMHIEGGVNAKIHGVEILLKAKPNLGLSSA
jgi:hypothetical protein